METLALLIHLPSDRTSHMPWRAALISANAPQYSIEDTDSTYFYVCDGASPTSAQLGTRHSAANEPERSRRAPKKIVSLFLGLGRGKIVAKRRALEAGRFCGFLYAGATRPRRIRSRIHMRGGLLAPLTNARPARFGFCGTCKSFGERRNRTGDGPPLAPAGDIPAALGLKTFLKETPMIDHLDGLDYTFMAFCFAVFGGTIWHIWRGKPYRQLQPFTSRFRINSSDVSP